MVSGRKNITSGETYFFRDKGQFSLIRFTIIPELMSRNKDKKALRIWSAGCATGEEAYSIAILLDENSRELEGWDVVILGTDINAEAIKRAGEGVYGEWSFRGVDEQIKVRYFKKVKERWLLKERIRKMVRFEVMDIINDSYPDYGLKLYDVDLILCRNVFIYFESEVTSKVIEKMTATLTDGGYLITGHAEMRVKERPFLKVKVFPESVIYQKDAGRRDLNLSLNFPIIPADKARKQINAPLPAMGNAVSESRSSAMRVDQEQHQPEIDHDLIQLAKVYADSGKYDVAIKYCREAIESAPFKPEPYYLIAQIARERGSLDEEKEMLNRVIYIDPSHVATYLELGIIYENEGNTAKSEKMRTTALKLLKGMPRDFRVEPYPFTVDELIGHVENMVK